MLGASIQFTAHIQMSVELTVCRKASKAFADNCHSGHIAQVKDSIDGCHTLEHTCRHDGIHTTKHIMV